MGKGICIVTGGTKGIGKAVIQAFAKEGFDIATCARNEEDLLALKSELTASFEVNVYTFKCDMSDRKQLNAFVDFIKLIGEPIEVLVNNTGQFIPGAILEEQEGVLEQMMSTNLYSAYHMTRAVVPNMKERNKGHIFNICSIASFHAYPNGGSYSITKFAMYGMSKVLREELKSESIRVTAVMPGATYTASWEGVDLPEDRLMPSEDIAKMIFATFSLSPRSVVEDIVIRPQLGDL